MRLAGATALVTGASSGIGRATAARLAREGARLVVTGRDPAALAAVAADTGALAVPADLTAAGAAERVAAEAGAVDLLVANAGIGWAGEFTEMAPVDAARLVQLDLLAPMLLTRLLLPGMVARGRGHLALVGSIASRVAVPRETVYSAAKAGLAAFADGLRGELAGRGVGVTVICPGVVATPFFERRGSPYARVWPRAIPPDRVAAALVRAVRTGRAEVFVPAWLRLPARLHGGWPALYRTLAARFG